MNALEKKEITIGLFLDLSKAFDSLDHHILLDKLYCYGMRGIVYKWFQSYLDNRKQYVSINGYTSNQKTIKCGVPQGSILGPLLFILYINDICNVSDRLKFILYADDTSVFMSNSDIQILQEQFASELKKLVYWLDINKLVLNINKTNFMLFSNKKVHNDFVYIKINDVFIKRVPYVKFLGVIIDEKLSWNQHTDVVCNKLAKNIGLLYRFYSYPKEVLLLLYNSLILPYLNYCIQIWANCSEQNMLRLLKLQKKAIRIVSHSDYRAHTMPIFDRLKILNIYNMYIYQSAIFMFSCSHSMLPGVLTNYFKLNSQVHTCITRNFFNYHLPFVRLSSYQKSIFYNGPKIWNELPEEIKSSQTFTIFKTHLKQYLSDRQSLE